MSAGTKRSNGLITILNKNLESVKELYKDERVLIISCKKDEEHFVVVNTYSPSDTESNKVKFLDSLNEKITRYTTKHTKS